MTTHRHDTDNFEAETRHHKAKGWRLVIAYLTDDDLAKGRIFDEVANCPACWACLVEHLAGAVSGLLIKGLGRPQASVAAHGILDEIMNAPTILDPPEDD